MASEPRALKTDFDANGPFGQLAYPHADGRTSKLVGLDATLTVEQVLPNRLPMAFDTSLGTDGQWFPWDPAGANGREVARGFLDTLIASQRTQSETGEKKMLILTDGVVNAAAIPDPADSPIDGYTLTYNATQRDAMLRSAALRDAGIKVTGLEAVG